ncbi:hypothetical protein HJFPF1_01733 [Paramyrothecium foliicola]|nr:hypothetical protein HJFPF1_01733 [Paramyrothecium foliicola]
MATCQSYTGVNWRRKRVRQQQQQQKMLRRPPTTLTITSEDVAAYEDRRAREALIAAQQARMAAANEAMEGVQSSPDPEARAVAARRARDERIGVAPGARRTGGR